MATVDGDGSTRGRVPGDGTYLNATPSDLAGVQPYAPPAAPMPPARRRTSGFVVVTALLVVVLLFIGLLVVSRSAAVDPATPPRADVPVAPAVERVAPMRVVYEVTAGGSDNVGSVSFTDQDGDIIRRNGIPLPWRTTFTADGRPPLVLHAQRKSGGDAGPVTCTITVDGKVVSQSTEQGRYAAPQCG